MLGIQNSIKAAENSYNNDKSSLFKRFYVIILTYEKQCN